MYYWIEACRGGSRTAQCSCITGRPAGTRLDSRPGGDSRRTPRARCVRGRIQRRRRQNVCVVGRARRAASCTASRAHPSSRLRSAILEAFTVEPFTFLFHGKHRPELIRPDLVEADSDAQFQRRPEIERATQEQPSLGRLRGVESVERAVVTTAAIVGSVRAEAGIAEFLATQRPMNQEPQGGFFGPLPSAQFGSDDSSKALSSASMAAFTATAWWMTGTSPA